MQRGVFYQGDILFYHPTALLSQAGHGNSTHRAYVSIFRVILGSVLCEILAFLSPTLFRTKNYLISCGVQIQSDCVE